MFYIQTLYIHPICSGMMGDASVINVPNQRCRRESQSPLHMNLAFKSWPGPFHSVLFPVSHPFSHCLVGHSVVTVPSIGTEMHTHTRRLTLQCGLGRS